MGICLLGGGKRNCDTHSIGCSGNLRKLDNPNLFTSTPAKLPLTQQLCEWMLCPAQAIDEAGERLCCLWSKGLGWSGVVWMCPMEEPCPVSHQGPAELCPGPPLPSACALPCSQGRARNSSLLWQNVFLKQCRDVFLQHSVFLFGFV